MRKIKFFWTLIFILFFTFNTFSGCAKSQTSEDVTEDGIIEEDSSPPPTTDECGAIKASVFPIINGTTGPDPTVANLTTSQQNAIGALIINYGEAGCTGTLVAPNVVLTAAHCVYSTPDFNVRAISFYMGEDYTRPIASFGASEWHPHPSYSNWPPYYDIAVVILRGDPVAYGATPIPVNCARTSLVGRTIQAVGYGLTYPETGYNSFRYWTTLPVSSERTEYYVTYSRSTGTCQGDSGGPMLYTMSDGVKVMGVVSSGDSYDCLGNTYWPRTDNYCSWLSSYIPADPCGGETYQGRCSGNTAIWCEGSTIRTQNCPDYSLVCGLDGSGNYRCVVPPDPCNGETLQGRCEDGKAIYCSLGRVVTQDCAAAGYDCGLNSEGNYRCIERQDPCGGETFQGRCEGNIAIWCESSTIMQSDCNAINQICSQDEWGNFRCIPAPQPCMGETFAGRCDGNNAIWCENDSVQMVPCPDGTLCGVTQDGLWRCVDECLITDRAGRCDENGRAIWCENGVRYVRDCNACGQLCGWVSDSLGYYCY